MNILFTVHSYWPVKDGVQYVTQYLAEGLAERGHSVTVVTSVTDREKVGTERHNGVKIVRVYLKAHYSIFVEGKEEYLRVLDELLPETEIMINCCVQSPINNVTLPFLKNYNCKKILYLHGMHAFKIRSEEYKKIKDLIRHLVMNLRWQLHYLYHRGNYNRYDLIVDIHESSEANAYFRKHGIRVRNITIHNAVECFDTVQDGNLLAEKDKYFLSVANYCPRKNQSELVSLFLRAKGIDEYKLVMIGASSEYSKRLKEDLVKNDVDPNRVVMIEDLDRETTKSYIKNCYCGIMASKFEVYPVFICETVICGHPFISTNVGCVKEIPGGLIANNSNEFVAAIEKMCKEPALAEKLSEQGHEYAAANFIQTEKVDQLERALFECVGNRTKEQTQRGCVKKI